MILPETTKHQKQILYFLYKFRFLSTNQIQILLQHSNPSYSQKLLKDLLDKEYIMTSRDRVTYKDYSQPFVYRLANRARQVLKLNEDCDLRVLNRIYKEKTRTNMYIDRCLAIADLYFFFLSQNKKEELQFFTESELVMYDFFPETKPSAYIAIQAEKSTRRYFLELFEKYIPPGVMRARFQSYIKYAGSGQWEANANGEDFPVVLFVCPTKNKKKHILYYAKWAFEKIFEEKFVFFATSIDKLKPGNTKNIWESVNI